MPVLAVLFLAALIFGVQVSIVSFMVWLIAYLIGLNLGFGAIVGVGIGVTMLINVLKS